MVERGELDVTAATVSAPVEAMLSATALERLRDMARQEQAPADMLRKSDLDLLAALDVLRDGLLTKAGLLLAGNAEAIARHLPNYSWTHERMKSATVYVDRADGRDTRELALPLALAAIETRINADNPITCITSSSAPTPPWPCVRRCSMPCAIWTCAWPARCW
jgi:ATP-dependent DNA helicase RecG